MDTANYSGPIAKIPKELQMDETTQNSESINQTNEDANEISVDMNWNIAEQLPEDGNCRAEFEELSKLFMNALITKSSAAEALEAITFYAYEIVERLHKDFASGKVSPATHFTNALIKILNNFSDLDDEVRILSYNFDMCLVCFVEI